MVQDGQEQLYDRCEKYSKLSFLIRLYHIKCLCGISNKALSMILELLVDAFPFAKIFSSFYEAKKTIIKLGLEYQKIDVCPNDCMLYWGKLAKHIIHQDENWYPKSKKQVKKPTKILRYFH